MHTAPLSTYSRVFIWLVFTYLIFVFKAFGIFFRQYWYRKKRSKFVYDWVEKTFQEILPIRILSKYYSSRIQLFVFCWFNDLQMYLVHSDTCNELCGYLFPCKKYSGIHKWWIAIWNWDINSFTKSKLGFCGLLF